jgi:hypothetical protein
MKRISFSLFLAAGLLSAAGLTAQVKGEGPVVKQDLNLEKLHSIGLGVAAKVYISKGAQQKATVEGQQNIIDLLKREVVNGSWEISFNSKNVGNYESLIIHLTLPSIQKLAIGGAGSIVVKDAFEGLGQVHLSIGGSGIIEMAGSAESATISIGGSGKVKAEGLRAKSCKVSIGGAGNAYVEATEELSVSIGGSGSVHYKGQPRIKSSIAGSGKLKPI